jgi:hypothetical protein
VYKAALDAAGRHTMANASHKSSVYIWYAGYSVRGLIEKHDSLSENEEILYISLSCAF